MYTGTSLITNEKHMQSQVNVWTHPDQQKKTQVDHEKYQETNTHEGDTSLKWLYALLLLLLLLKISQISNTEKISSCRTYVRPRIYKFGKILKQETLTAQHISTPVQCAQLQLSNFLEKPLLYFGMQCNK